MVCKEVGWVPELHTQKSEGHFIGKEPAKDKSQRVTPSCTCPIEDMPVVTWKVDQIE